MSLLDNTSHYPVIILRTLAFGGSKNFKSLGKIYKQCIFGGLEFTVREINKGQLCCLIFLYIRAKPE